MTGPLALALAVCQDCAGKGLLLVPMPYLPAGSRWVRTRLVPVGCRSCRGHGRYPATEATGGTR